MGEMRNQLPLCFKWPNSSSSDNSQLLLSRSGTKRGNSLDRRKSVVVRTLTWLFLSFFFGVFSPFTLLYKVTTKLYNENGKNGGDGEFLIITDNYYRQLTFHILRISHEHDAHNSHLYRDSNACDDNGGHTSKQA